jgi:phage baseplate assembly protein W
MATTTTTNEYGVPITLAVKRSATSQYKRKAGFAYPLTMDLGSTVTGGVVNRTATQGPYFRPQTGLQLIRNNLRQLLLCDRGERVMLPNYGLDLKKYLFEPMDQTTFNLIKQEISDTLNTYFSIARIISLRVLADTYDAENSSLVISLTLQIQDESLDIFDAEVRVG